VPMNTLDFSASYTHDLPGNTFQMLTNDVAYLKLSSVQAAKSASYIQSAVGTKGLIIDIRNYPSEFVVFSLGSLLVSDPTNFVRFTNGDVTNPGAFHWGATLGLTPQQPHYAGKVVILVDEETQSQAEYTTMAFRTAPGAIVIGSTTAGADGNVSAVPLPGGFSSYISGLGVFYPDNRPTQRVGIIPDVVVTPTIEAIRAGRDELIEEAMRQIAGASSSHSAVKR
jgi:C-terminal processing protease CtpA/Prc